MALSGSGSALRIQTHSPLVASCVGLAEPSAKTSETRGSRSLFCASTPQNSILRLVSEPDPFAAEISPPARPGLACEHAAGRQPAAATATVCRQVTARNRGHVISMCLAGFLIPTRFDHGEPAGALAGASAAGGSRSPGGCIVTHWAGWPKAR
jgi:hypothetical protein